MIILYIWYKNRNDQWQQPKDEKCVQKTPKNYVVMTTTNKKEVNKTGLEKCEYCVIDAWWHHCNYDDIAVKVDDTFQRLRYT
jgi:hypothetical protein